MRRMGDMGITRSPSTGVYAGLEARLPDGRTLGGCPELGAIGAEPTGEAAGCPPAAQPSSAFGPGWAWVWL